MESGGGQVVACGQGFTRNSTGATVQPLSGAELGRPYSHGCFFAGHGRQHLFERVAERAMRGRRPVDRSYAGS